MIIKLLFDSVVVFEKNIEGVPTPPPPSPPPNIDPVPGAIKLDWNKYNAPINIAKGQSLGFKLSKPTLDNSSIQVTIYPISFVEIACEFWTPEGKQPDQTIGYPMSAKFRLAPPVPLGDYFLKITGNTDGTIQVRALLQ